MDPKIVVKIVLIPTYSNAIFHEESEYVVGFKILAKKSGTFLDVSQKLNFFLLKKMKVHFLYFTYIFAKTRFILKNFITKMISKKFSSNRESFKKFRRGHRMDLARSGGMIDT